MIYLSSGHLTGPLVVVAAGASACRYHPLPQRLKPLPERVRDLDSSLCMDTLGAFGTTLWSVIDRAIDPNTHPRASGDYDPWRRPDPRREYVLSVAFANQIGDAIMVRGADARRRRNRSGGRYATGARA